MLIEAATAFPTFGTSLPEKGALGITIRHLGAILVSRRQVSEVVNDKRAISRAKE
jgi:hypothetical protein